MSRRVRCRRLTNFGEGNQLAAGLSSLVDEVNGLSDTTLKIEPLRTVRLMCMRSVRVGNLLQARR
jgi:hypothetical protein